MKIGDKVIHILTKEKVLVLRAFTQWDMDTQETRITGWECRLQNYDIKIFHDIELGDIKQKKKIKESEK